MATVSDCRVSQVVNIKKGIHCLNPRNPATRGHGAPDGRDLEILRRSSDADLNKAMNSASMGMFKFLESRGRCASRCLWAGERGDGSPRRRNHGDEKNVHCVLPKSLWQAPR